jgi:hypothetical protein
MRPPRANARRQEVGYFDGGRGGCTLEKQIPFGSAQGRLSRQKQGARNDKVKVAHY